VIGEFVGSGDSLGNLLLSANAQLNGPLACAALVRLSVLGILLFIAVIVVQRLTMPWADVARHDSGGARRIASASARRDPQKTRPARTAH
jgi:hypothetical protein